MDISITQIGRIPTSRRTSRHQPKHNLRAIHSPTSTNTASTAELPANPARFTPETSHGNDGAPRHPVHGTFATAK
jgi:hypothetical protein